MSILDFNIGPGLQYDPSTNTLNLADPNSPPDAPTNLTVVGAKGELSIGFVKPINSGSSDIDHYVIRVEKVT